MTVSRRLRFEILKRDTYTCRYCGASAPDAVLQVDHVIPTTLGGSDEATNLATSCDECNGGKSSVHPDSGTVDDVETDAIRWAKAIEVAAARMQSGQQAIENDLYCFEESWESWKGGQWDSWRHSPPSAWKDSVRTFLTSGLSLETLLRFMDKSLHKTNGYDDKAWKYFCGCCWTEIGNIQEEARRMIEDGEA